MFAVDALVCARCLGPLTVIAYVSDPAVAVKILAHLRLPTTSPELAPARRPAQPDLFEQDAPADPWPSARRTTRAPRGPPAGADRERWVDLDQPDDPDPDNWGA